MTILDAIRTLRKEKNMTFEQAKKVAYDHFKLKGLPIPESIESILKNS